MNSNEKTNPAGDALPGGHAGPELDPLQLEIAALKDQLDTLAELQLRTITERDAARENFQKAMVDRDEARNKVDSLERLVTDVKTRSSQRADRIDQLEKENAALLERLQRSVA